MSSSRGLGRLGAALTVILVLSALSVYRQRTGFDSDPQGTMVFESDRSMRVRHPPDVERGLDRRKPDDAVAPGSVGVSPAPDAGKVADTMPPPGWTLRPTLIRGRRRSMFTRMKQTTTYLFNKKPRNTMEQTIGARRRGGRCRLARRVPHPASERPQSLASPSSRMRPPGPMPGFCLQSSSSASRTTTQ